MNAREHFHHGPYFLDRQALQGFDVYVVDDVQYELEHGFRAFRDCERPHPAIACSRATLRPSTGFQPVQDTYEAHGINLADLRQARLADALIFREDDQRFALCQLKRQCPSSLPKSSRVEASYLVETKPELLKLVHIYIISLG
jgi:hypothetical protein